MEGVSRYAAVMRAKHESNNSEDHLHPDADGEHAEDAERVLDSLGPAAVTLLYYLPEIEEVLNESDLGDLSLAGGPGTETLIQVSAVLEEMPTDVITMVEELKDTAWSTLTQLGEELAEKAHTSAPDRLAAFLFLGSRLPRLDLTAEMGQS